MRHFNFSANTVTTIQAAPANTTVPRRVGVWSTGTYWGGAGEQIDLLSGNLNYTVPLITAKSRGGWSAGFSLNYNSQMWRQDLGGTWKLGRDVGYGLGWKLLAGSITPVYLGTWYIHHFIFTDSTGAEYRLDTNNGNVWTSHEGFYGWFDANRSTLYSPDGSYWLMWVTSGGAEEDAGTLYPAFFYDTNGNYIQLDYAASAGSGLGASSARLTRIWDSRVWNMNAPIYTFSYNSDTIPHLTSIQCAVTQAESYTLNYQTNQSLYSPFDQTPFGTATWLQSVGTTGLGPTTTFQYASSGEMTQMTTPMGGSLLWHYRTYTYSGTRRYREVDSRQVTASMGALPWSYSISLDSNTNLHAAATVADAGAGTQKVWTFNTSGTYLGMTASYEERDTTNAALMRKDYTWTADGVGRPYIGTAVTTLNPGQSYAAQTKNTQTLDVYGNLAQSAVYNYGDLTTPARTYNFTYLTGTNYASRYFYNRLLTASVNTGGAFYLVTNTYDSQTLTTATGMLHDDGNYGTGLAYRGNVTQRITTAGTSTTQFNMLGVVRSATNEAGVTVTTATDTSTNYSLPSAITPNGEANLATSISYASSWAVTSVTGANGSNATTTYDGYGRPATSKIPDGATTNYAYTYLPNTQTATLGSRWTKTTMDGFGRAVKVETGHDAVTVSVAETEYAPCACSPLGKLYRTSRPHAPGTSPIWTTNTYDGRGRTLTVTLADGSVTTYLYQGNTTKVTDAAGKWKKQTTDAMGNLVTVTEPNPAGGSDWTTVYYYDQVNHLMRVEMPRPYQGGTYTQVRTFAWNDHDMTSETNPETGTITYGYDSAHRMTSRTDAKNQQRQYSYDAYGRVTSVRYYILTTHYQSTYPYQYQSWDEQENQRVDYHYDTNTLDAQYSQNAWGRLTTMEFKNPDGGERFSYQYSYSQAGRVTNQRMRVTPTVTTQAFNLEATYAWDNEGRMTSLTGPSNGPTDSYTYDAMGRLSSGGASYGPAGELLSFNGVTRTYNTLGQLTRMTKSGVMDMEYRYTAGQNNGRITQSKDWVTGEEVTYQYDSLNRLLHAETTDSAWGTTYSYDGWGNLTAKAVTKGSAPGGSWSYDPALNMTAGSQPPTYIPQFYFQNNDVEDRPLNGTSQIWKTWQGLARNGRLTYDHTGKKVLWRAGHDPDNDLPERAATCEIYFYGITGQLLARYQCSYHQTDPDPMTFDNTLYDRTQHVGGQLTSQNGTGVTTDRLGSVRAKDNGERYTYYPYGETHTESVAGGGMYAGLEAPARSYDSGMGRFDRPDPLGVKGAQLSKPATWNRFAYAAGDPINFYDPRGLASCKVTGNATRYSNPDDGEDPVYSAEIQCTSEGGLITNWYGWVPEPGGPNDNRQLESDYLSAYGAALDRAEQVSSLESAVSVARLALGQERCRSLFSDDFDPVSVLNHVYDGDSVYGRFSWQPLGANGSVAEVRSYQPSVGSATGWTVDVVINASGSGGWFDMSTWTARYGNLGNIVFNAATVIHELGHVFENLFGANTSQIVDDSHGGSQNNTDRVLQNCFGVTPR